MGGVTSFYKAKGVVSRNSLAMAESDELEAIRVRRLAELQAEHGGVSCRYLNKWRPLKKVCNAAIPHLRDPLTEGNRNSRNSKRGDCSEFVPTRETR